MTHPTRESHYRHTHIYIILLAVLVGIVLGMWYVERGHKPPVVAEPQATTLEELQGDFTRVADKVKPSVVSIISETVIPGRTFSPLEEFFGSPFDEEFKRFFEFREPEQKVRGLGSGFIIGSDGYILTNYHVIKRASKIVVHFPVEDKDYPAQIKGTDPGTDLAVLKVNRTGLPALELGDSSSLQVGQWAIAVGSPFGLEQTVTVGVISALGRRIPDVLRFGYENLIQTDASINRGNSGGPLLDIHGKVIGINTVIFSQTGGNIGIGFAIPADTAKYVAQKLIEEGKISRGRLGISIQELTPEMAERFGVKEGVVVADVEAGSPAEKAGLKRGDVIVSLNGQKMQKPGDLQRGIAELGPGQRAEMVVVRNGKKQSIRAVTGEWGSEEEVALRPSPPPPSGNRSALGIEVISLEQARKQGSNIPAEAEGVFVINVDSNSNAFSAGVRPGLLLLEVNGIAIDSVQDYENATKNIKKGESIVLLVQEPGEHTVFLGFRAD